MSETVDTLDFYSSVRLRPTVEIDVRDNEATFRYRALSFDIEFPDGCRAPVSEFCQVLRDGVDVPHIKRILPFEEGQTNALLDTLDRYGFLTENAPSAPAPTLSGRELWNEIRGLSERVKTTLPAPFTDALLTGEATYAQLAAYVLQYFHIVRHGARIAAAAYASARSPEAESILEGFARGEFGHDRLLAKSLSAIGLDANECASQNPWTETFAIISHLHVLADQDPLSFAGCVFLVEDTAPEFHQAFERCCELRGMPDGFARPILQHAAINDDGCHGDISAALLAGLDVVSEEQRDVVLCHVVTLLESLAKLDEALARVR